MSISRLASPSAFYKARFLGFLEAIVISTFVLTQDDNEFLTCAYNLIFLDSFFPGLIFVITYLLPWIFRGRNIKQLP